MLDEHERGLLNTVYELFVFGCTKFVYRTAGLINSPLPDCRLLHNVSL